MKIKPEWTKPFHGITHLNGLREGFQVTVSEYAPGSSARVVLFVKGSPNFFSGRESGVASTFGEAKEIGLKWVEKYNAWKE